MSSSSTTIVVDSVPDSHARQTSSSKSNSRSGSPLSQRSSLTGRPRSNSASLQREVEAERAEVLSDVKEQESQRFGMVDQLHHNLEETSHDAMAMFARTTPKTVELPPTVDDDKNSTTTSSSLINQSNVVPITQSSSVINQPNVVSQETFTIKPTSANTTHSSHPTREHLEIPSKSSHTHATLIDTLSNYDPAHHSHQNILPSKPYTSASDEALAEKDAQIAALSMALIKARTAHREAVYQNQLLTDPEAAMSTSVVTNDDSRPLTSSVDRSSALLTVVPTAKDDQSLRSYLQKLPAKRDSLTIKRASSGPVSQKFVTLTYDALYVSDNADDQGSKIASLSHYWLIERAEDSAKSGTISEYAASHSRQANAPPAPLSPMAGHSIFRKEEDQFVIRLVPVVRDPSAPHLIVEPDVNQLLEITAPTDRASVAADFLAEWVDAINLRISLLNLLKAEDHSQVLAHGGKQILTFLCSVDSNSLVLENRYLNALKVLPHFKEALVHRRNYSITFRNVGLDDNGVRVLSEILMMNHSITAIDLSWNAITDAGMSYLSPVFELNKQALNQSVNLSYNLIQGEGVREFAQAIANHPVCRVILRGNKLGDDGVMQFFTALTGQNNEESEKRTFQLLDLSDNELTNGAFGPLGSMLALMKIESLNLSHNQFTDAGLAALMVRLKQGESASMSSLRSIDLSFNRLTVGALTSLLSLLKSTRNVRLDLSGNHLSSQAFKALIDSDVSLQIDSLAIRAVASTAGRSGESELNQPTLEKRFENAAAGMNEKVNSARLTAGSLFGRLMGRKGSRAEASPSPVNADDHPERRASFSGAAPDLTADKSLSPPAEKSKTPEPI